MSEYINTYIMWRGKAYRVAFHTASQRPMICCRRVRSGFALHGSREVALALDGPTARAVIAAALSGQSEALITGDAVSAKVEDRSEGIDP